jgi:hypothetical protein
MTIPAMTSIKVNPRCFFLFLIANSSFFTFFLSIQAIAIPRGKKEKVSMGEVFILLYNKELHGETAGVFT